MAFVALLDACVLVPPDVRDLLIELAYRGFYRALWSTDILAEVRRTLVHKHAVAPEKVDSLLSSLHEAVLDAEVQGYEDLVSGLILPDPDDRHVLAAAIRGGAGVIVTANLKDFPPDSLAPFQLEAKHPDEFLVNLYDLYGSDVLEASRYLQSLKRKPARTWDEHLQKLTRLLPGVAKCLRSGAEVERIVRAKSFVVETETD